MATVFNENERRAPDAYMAALLRRPDFWGIRYTIDASTLFHLVVGRLPAHL